jgi:hypothetical protein
MGEFLRALSNAGKGKPASARANLDDQVQCVSGLYAGRKVDLRRPDEVVNAALLNTGTAEAPSA